MATLSVSPLKVIFMAMMTTLFSVPFILGAVNYFEYDELTRSGVRTQAQIVKTNCSQHSSFTYHFTVGTKSVEGHGNDGGGTPSCSSLKPGDSVPVYYLSTDYSVHTVGDPAEHRDNEKVFLWLIGTLCPAFLLAILKWFKI